MNPPYQVTRLRDGKKTSHQSIATALDAEKLFTETWLFVTPHDDDLCISSALWMQAAVAERVNIRVLVVTDGRMGYCTLQQRESISDIRRRETYESFALLGIGRDRIDHIDYPDGGLYAFQGRRAAESGDEPNIAGYVGLQNSFTYFLRERPPARVFVPTRSDLHPDHQIVHNELMISLFHAAGTIWPELGAALTEVPAVYELAVYCDFPEPPQIQIQSDEKLFEKKLSSIAAYKSQTQIARLVESIRAAGPFEYIRELNFRFYSPNNYKHLFGT